MRKTSWERRRDNAALRVEKHAATLLRAVRKRQWAEVDRISALGLRAERDYERARQKVGALMQARMRKLYPAPVVKRMKEDDYVDEDVYASEWEFGFEYDAEGGMSSNVDVNFRVSRDNGAEISATDARQVMNYVRLHRGDTPRGYSVTGIDWRNPPRPYRSTEQRGLSVSEVQDTFVAVLDKVEHMPHIWKMRQGAVKH